MTDARKRLVQCFAAVFPQLSESEIVRANTAAIGSWDSVATVTLITVAEEEFGIRVPPEDFEELTSFDLMLDYVEHAPDGR
jgi:acyl carrier protein